MTVNEYPTGKWADWDEAELLALKPGTKLIFVRHSGVLGGKPGDVVTFENLYFTKRIVDEEYRDYPSNFQCKEFFENGKMTHNLSFETVALFDPETYPKHRHLTLKILKREEKRFIEKWGA